MNALVRADTEHAVERDAAQQFLSFALGGETYALAIARIKEIIEYQRPTTVPCMPCFVRGVINLRGAVVPVIDLGARFGGAPSEVTRRSCVVILELQHGEALQTLGLMVDAVHEVVEFATSDIGPPPPFGTRIRADFIAGMARRAERLMVVLDASRVLSLDELAQLDNADTATEAAANA
ncbi:MAG TPA: chemotaxis protein CheW [Arenimonas sp.]|nr:chemotaxis protein CheW [Arenimonas sp.]